MLKTLPIETWTHSFLFACTDGGYTGCSLALVSHHFRRAVLPVQLHSVVLTSTWKTIKFADLLERRLPQHRKVRHLLLAPIYIRTSRLRQTFFDVTLDCADFNALDRVFAFIAPDLLTLTSAYPQDVYSLRRMFSATLPSLVELTMHGCDAYRGQTVGEASHNNSDTTPPVVWFPSLRYMHILSSAQSCPLLLVHAPTLTHLRLSSAAPLHDSLRNALIVFLRDNTAPDARPFPTSLERILIEPRGHLLQRIITRTEGLACPPGQYCRALADADTEHKLVLLNSGCTQDLLLGVSYDPRKDWEDRMLGGPGCWAVEEDEWRSFPELPQQRPGSPAPADARADADGEFDDSIIRRIVRVMGVLAGDAV